MWITKGIENTQVTSSFQQRKIGCGENSVDCGVTQMEVGIPMHPCTNCVLLSETLNLSEHPFPQLPNIDGN